MNIFFAFRTQSGVQGKSQARVPQEVTSACSIFSDTLKLYLKRFLYSPTELLPSQSSPYSSSWEAIVRHACHVSCPSDWNLLEKSVHARSAGLCEDFRVRYHVLPSDFQEFAQTAHVEMSCLACLLYTVQVSDYVRVVRAMAR